MSKSAVASINLFLFCTFKTKNSCSTHLSPLYSPSLYLMSFCCSLSPSYQAVSVQHISKRLPAFSNLSYYISCNESFKHWLTTGDPEHSVPECWDLEHDLCKNGLGGGGGADSLFPACNPDSSNLFYVESCYFFPPVLCTGRM